MQIFLNKKTTLIDIVLKNNILFKALSECAQNTCRNGGTCVGKWDDSKNICNCDLTTYAGKYCETSK